MNPNYTSLTADQPDLVWATLAGPDRSIVVIYLCTRTTGQSVRTASAQARLPAGAYRVTFQRPADLGLIKTQELRSDGLGQADRIVLPDFMDDLIVTVGRL